MIDFATLLQEHLIAKNAAKELEHVRSGYLSASRLGKSSLENVLSLLEVPSVPLTPYALGVFARGNQVEDWFVEQFNELGLIEREQEELKYTNNGWTVIGYEDVKFKDDPMPTEIKSIKNSQFKYLDKEGAKMAHRLQACVYALAQGADKFRVLYVSAEDFRLKEFTYSTDAYKEEVDKRTNAVYQALKSGVLPVFEPLDSFMASDKYLDYTGYPEWFGKYEIRTINKPYTTKTGKVVNRNVEEKVLVEPYTQEQLMRMLEVEHPIAFKKLKEGDLKCLK